jgi:hypothetical protein
MGRRVRLGSALVAGTLAFVVVGTSTAHAILSQTGYKCQTAIANEAGKYVKGKLKLIQKCKDANLATPGSCLAPDAAALTKLDDKLSSGLAKKCSFDGLGDNLRASGRVLGREMNSGQLAHELRARYLVDVETYAKVQGQPLVIQGRGGQAYDAQGADRRRVRRPRQACAT